MDAPCPSSALCCGANSMRLRSIARLWEVETIEEFKSVLEKARANELVRKQDWEREKAREAQRVRQLDVI